VFELLPGCTFTEPTSLFVISVGGVFPLSVKSRVSVLLLLLFPVLVSVLLLLSLTVLVCEPDHPVIAVNMVSSSKRPAVVTMVRCIVFFNLFSLPSGI